MRAMYRQGDVLIVPVDEVPEGTKAVRRSKAGRIILAHGEVTGHAHAIASPPDEAILVRRGSDRYLRVLASSVPLEHQEHATIDIEQGDYRVVRQREYTPTQNVRVAD